MENLTNIATQYKLVFSLEGKMDNLGFLILSGITIVYILLLILYFTIGTTSIKNFIFKEMENNGYDLKAINKNKRSGNKADETVNVKKKIYPKKGKKGKRAPPKKKEDLYKKKSDKNLDKKIGAKSKNLNDSFNSENKIIDNKNLTNDNNNFLNNNDFNIININLNNRDKKNIPPNSRQILNGYSFEEAIKYDTRSLCLIYYIFLLSKQILFYAFLFRSPLDPFSVRFAHLFFLYASDLAFNSLMMSLSSMIPDVINFEINLFQIDFNLTNIAVCTLFGFVFMVVYTNLNTIMSTLLKIFKRQEKKIEDKTYKGDNKKLVRQMKFRISNLIVTHQIKIGILLLSELILILGFWYFITSFCHLNQDKQKLLIINGSVPFLIRFIFDIVFSMIFALLYKVSVSSKIHWMYRTIMFIYEYV